MGGRVAVGVVCSVALAACGSGNPSSKVTSTVASSAATTTTAPTAIVEIRPDSGPIGTTFRMLGLRFENAEIVTFEIIFPNAKVFTGQPHQATADGTVSTSYRVTTGEPPGTYQVKVTGDRGSHAAGHFEVTTSRTTAAAAGGSTSATAARRNAATMASAPGGSQSRLPGGPGLLPADAQGVTDLGH